MLLRSRKKTARSPSAPVRKWHTAAVACAVMCGVAWATPAQALTQVECPALEEWAGAYVPEETVSLAPEVEVTTLLRDDRTEPLFGADIATWENGDLTAVRRWLVDCRKNAVDRRDDATSDRLYKAIKALDRARPSLTRMGAVRLNVMQKVEGLEAQANFPQLPALLDLAGEALRGASVRDAVRDLRVRGGAPRLVLGLEGAADYLPDAEVDALVARLDARRAAVAAEDPASTSTAPSGVAETPLRAPAAAAVRRSGATRAADVPDSLRKALNEAPASRAGLQTLQALADAPELDAVDPDQAALFRRQVMQKRADVQRALQALAARQAAFDAAQRKARRQALASRPAAFAPRLDALLDGEEPAGLAVGALHPGMSYEEAKRALADEWGFGGGTMGDVFKVFTPTRRDVTRLTETDFRDGGVVEIDTMRGTVGQIRFTENFTGPLDMAGVRGWLVALLGEPDDEQRQTNRHDMQWDDDAAGLHIIAANQVFGQRSRYTYKSAIVLTLWSTAYKDYLAEANERCTALRNKPMGDLSVVDRQDILRGCLEE